MTRHRHPTPRVLASYLHGVADRIADHGDTTIDQAAVLAARGWPTSTLGSGGGRSADETTSTERAALDPGPYDGLDDRLALVLRRLWDDAIRADETIDHVLSHASDDDPVPPGTGPCKLPTCEHLCQPRRNPDDRIKAGYCPTHYRRWLRLGKPDTMTYVRILEQEQAA